MDDYLVPPGNMGFGTAWEFIGPAFRSLVYHNIIGLTNEGKEAFLQVIKDRFADVDIETLENKELPDIAVKLKEEYFDTRNCSNCSHEKVCSRAQLIKEVKSQGIEVNRRCDQWLKG